MNHENFNLIMLSVFFFTISVGLIDYFSFLKMKQWSFCTGLKVLKRREGWIQNHFPKAGSYETDSVKYKVINPSHIIFRYRLGLFNTPMILKGSVKLHESEIIIEGRTTLYVVLFAILVVTVLFVFLIESGLTSDFYTIASIVLSTLFAFLYGSYRYECNRLLNALEEVKRGLKSKI